MEPWKRDLAGRLEEHVVVGDALRGNPLGDPHERPLLVYLPPGYDDDPGRRYPAVYVLQGFTGQVDMWRNRSAFRPSAVELTDELFASGGAPPAIVVYVDAWTSIGGSQFVDSPAVGNYQTYLCDDVVPFVDAAFRTASAREHRGVQGKSSGGYGAMVSALVRPDVFGGLATHAGDALFEVCYLPDFREAARAVTREYGGSFDAFWRDFRSRPAFTKRSDHTLMNAYAMSACYSADADGTVRFPFDPATGALVPEVWERWLAKDPVRMVRDRAEAARSLKAIYVDAGSRDEFYLDLGAEAFRRALEDVGVTDVFFELFDAGHGSTEYRYPKAIAYLAERLAP